MTSAAHPENSGTPPREAWPLRLLRALRQMNADQVELWERWARAQRPWEADWLHWEQDEDGAWHLEGKVAPPRTGHGPVEPPG